MKLQTLITFITRISTSVWVINDFRHEMTYIQWCTGEYLKTIFLGEKAQFVDLANFCGVTISITASFQLPGLHHSTWSWEDICTINSYKLVLTYMVKVHV